MNSNAKNKVKLIWCDDWEVIYINGKKVFSYHSADSTDWLSFLKEELNFDTEELEVNEEEMHKYE